MKFNTVDNVEFSHVHNNSEVKVLVDSENCKYDYGIIQEIFIPDKYKDLILVCVKWLITLDFDEELQVPIDSEDIKKNKSKKRKKNNNESNNSNKNKQKKQKISLLDNPRLGCAKFLPNQVIVRPDTSNKYDSQWVWIDSIVPTPICLCPYIEKNKKHPLYKCVVEFPSSV